MNGNYLKGCLLTVLALLLADFVQGQSLFAIHGDEKEWLLNEHLEVMETSEEEAVLEAVFPAKFTPYAEFVKAYPATQPTGQQLLDPHKIYWWRIRLRNETGRDIYRWVLHTGRSNSTVVFVLGENGVADTSYTGYLTPACQKDFQIGNRQDERVAFSLPADSTVTLYGRVAVFNSKPPFIQLRLSPTDFYQSWDYVLKSRGHWAFLGFLLSYVLLNLLLYVSTLDRVFLWHSLFQTGIFIYLMEFFNILPDIPWLRDHPHLLQYVIYVALCLMDVACLQFVRYYMVMKRSQPVWDTRFKYFIWARIGLAAVVIGLYYALMNVRLTDNITAASMVLGYLGIIFLLVKLFGKTDRRSFYLIAGTAFFVTGVVLNALYVIMGIGLRFSFTQIGVMGEVALFTLGLGFRMTFLQNEQRKALMFKGLDEFKTRFYTNITHEFRTPLTVILGMAEQLDTAAKQPIGSQQEKVDTIRRNGQQLLRLINQLLDLSKAQSGKLALQLQRSDVADYLRYLVGSFHSFAAAKDIRLRFLTEIDQLDMDFDAEKLENVVTNLLSNAVKFTPPGGEITVSLAQKQPETLTLQVRDNGAGISDEMLPHVFDRYFTTKDSGNPSGGSGVGLALTKELVELMGGTISVESKLGSGASFTVHLPITKNAAATALPISKISTTAALPADLPSSFATVPTGEKPICLVIDDSADIVRYLQMLLEPSYSVAVAYDGKRGIEKALELAPDVIISDVMMPEKDGLEVCDFLKNDERTSHIPIILLTAKASVADRIEGLRRGADAYLQKPFDKEELFVHLQKSRELRQRMLHYFTQKSSAQTAGVPPDIDLKIEDEFLQKARAAVQENLSDEDFDIHRLCRALTMSRAQLHRKLTALTGASATHFIRKIRLERARQLLQTTDLNIAEIAYEVGFRDPNYFSRTFAEEFGTTPSETRK